MKALTLIPPEMPCPIHLRPIRANIIKLLATIIARDPLGRVARRFSADFDEDIDVVFALLGVVGGDHDLWVTAEVVDGGFGVGVSGFAFEAVDECGVLSGCCKGAGYHGREG